MTHDQKLEAIIQSISKSTDKLNYPSRINADLDFIVKNIENASGAYHIIITCMVHKLLNPTQDIRRHQAKNMDDGFGCRTINRKYILPVLLRHNISFRQSEGHLTRGFEKPNPFNLDFHSNLKPPGTLKAFLNILDYVETKKPDDAELIVKILISGAQDILKSKDIDLPTLDTSRKFISIDSIIKSIGLFVSQEFNTSGASKIPVLAFYAIYQIITEEMSRYKDCKLLPLKSHTTPDGNSKSFGDIEVVNAILEPYEGVEIKYNVPINELTVQIVFEKIKNTNISRYYLLSNKSNNINENKAILNLVEDLKNNYGIQLIINGYEASLKYYLRLIDDPQQFIYKFNDLLTEKNDKEIKLPHLKAWEEIYKNFLL